MNSRIIGLGTLNVLSDYLISEFILSKLPAEVNFKYYIYILGDVEKIQSKILKY